MVAGKCDRQDDLIHDVPFPVSFSLKAVRRVRYVARFLMEA